MKTNINSKKGFGFVLPESIQDKDVSVIEVGPFNEHGLANELNKFFETQIENLFRIDSYILVHPTGLENIESLIEGKPFVDRIIHKAALNESLALKLGLPFDYVLQSMYNAGTSDSEGNNALTQALIKLGKKKREDDVGFYSKQFFLKSDTIREEQLEQVSAFLANPELYIRLKLSKEQFKNGYIVEAPIVTLKPEIKVEEYDVVNMSDEELLKLNSKRRLAGNLEELHQFMDMYKDPEFIKKRKEHGLSEKATDVELETWFGLRSEHCFHKEFNAKIILEDRVNDPIFQRAFEKGLLTKNNNGEYVLEDGLFKTFIKRPAETIYDKLEKRGKNWIVSMFEDNSGVVYYNEDFMFCIKFETHNSPSNKEPIQGAKTGIDGVNRDIFGTMLGTFDAIANFFMYCTGNPFYKGWLPKGVKHPYVILKGITQGIREGGNESQIGTFGGSLITDPRFIAKCLVHAGTVGWSPIKSLDGISYIGKNQKKGDLVFVAGHPVGVDGVHGATESSLIADKHISLGHVQADDSYTQAKLKQYLLEVARANLLTATTDFGAMGLGSSSHEIAIKTGGLYLDLALRPKKYKGIQPWQINASETQDNMLLVTSPDKKDELMKRAKIHDVQVTELGELTDSGYIHLKYEKDTVALIDIKKLFDKEPRKNMHATWYESPKEEPLKIKNKYSLEASLCLVMEQPDVASKEWFFRQKDSSVKGSTIQAPLIGRNQEVDADATIQKPLDTEGKDYGAIAYSYGIEPKMSDIDPYHSAQKSFLDMVGKIIAVGCALPDMKNPKWDAWAVCGNYCQPNSESSTTLIKESGEHNLASLLREGLGVHDASEKLNIPIISGKDSMKCSCEYELDLDEFLKDHDSEFAKIYMGLSEEVREDLDKVKEHFGEDYNSEIVNKIILESIPPDLGRHIAIVEKKRKKKDEKIGKEYEVLGLSVEIHNPDSYLASSAVKIDDYRKCIDSSFKKEGDFIFVIGATEAHLGASQYANAIGYKEQGAPLEGGQVPKANLDEFIKVAEAIHSAIDEEVVASCSYIHKGGLITVLAKAAMAGEKGAGISVNKIAEIGINKIYRDNNSLSDEELLFSETPGRFIVTVAPENINEFANIMYNHNSKYGIIGKVISKNLKQKKLDGSIEITDLAKVKQSYQKPLSFGLHEVE